MLLQLQPQVDLYAFYNFTQPFILARINIVGTRDACPLQKTQQRCFFYFFATKYYRYQLLHKNVFYSNNSDFFPKIDILIYNCMWKISFLPFCDFTRLPSPSRAFEDWQRSEKQVF